MRFLMLTLALGAAGVLALPQSPSARPSAPVSGAPPCTAFLRQAGSDGRSDPVSLQWVLGYIAGRVAAAREVHRPIPEPEDVARIILTYCRAHPAGSLDVVAAGFFKRNRICGANRSCR